MMRRVTIAAALLAVMTSVTGCAWSFQEHLHGGLDSYTADAPPRCSDSRGWAITDGVFAALNAAGAVMAATNENVENRTTVLTSGVLWAVVHIASAITGMGWAGECRSANEAWSASGASLAITRDEERRRAGLELAGNRRNDPRKARAFWCAPDGECVGDQGACGEECTPRATAWCTASPAGFICRMTRDTCLAVRYGRRDPNLGECVEWRPGLAGTPEPPPRGPAPARPAPAPPAPAAPRGFFCSISAGSPTASFCTREKADCQRARDAAVTAVADLGECGLVETAFCATAGGSERCAPTLEACTERASAATGATGASGACEERK